MNCTIFHRKQVGATATIKVKTLRALIRIYFERSKAHSEEGRI